MYGLRFFGRRGNRIKAVQDADNDRIDNSTDQAAGKVGHEVEHAAFATFSKTLVEFIGTTVCKSKKTDYKHP